MRYAIAALLLAALCLPGVQAAQPQQGRPDAVLSLLQAERNAADLRRGMSAEDVRGLLGKPKRTGLKESGLPSSFPQGALQWTYVWNGTNGPSTLHVDFVSDAPEQWRVHGWEWSSY